MHGGSVETLLTWFYSHLDVKQLKNLRCLYIDYLEIDSTFLPSLKQLNEIHLGSENIISDCFEQKRQHGRHDLKIYFQGLCLNGPDDTAIRPLSHFVDYIVVNTLEENQARLADEMPSFNSLTYSTIADLAPEFAVEFLSRTTNLNTIYVIKRVKDIERFLEFLRNFGDIRNLEFDCDQPQDLFDRLPEHCALQQLTINHEVQDLDLGFLLRLTHLTFIDLAFSIDVQLVRKVFEELRFVSWFRFRVFNKEIRIEIGRSKQFQVRIDQRDHGAPDLDAVIQLIIRNSPETKGIAK